jgi:hypothetical protein
MRRRSPIRLCASLVKEVSKLSRVNFPARPALLAAAILAAAALLAGPAPAPAQQALPGVTHSAPAAAVRGVPTTVNLSFSLPPGFKLVGNPRVRVTDGQGALIELLPTYITQRPPLGKGNRALHTSAYRPGTYQVHAEIVYLDPAGKRGVVASPASTLTVAKR